MKLPTPKFLANSNVKIQVVDGTDENGAQNITNEIDVGARLQQSNSIVYTKEGKKVSLKAKLFIFEKLDEIPDDVSGFCIVNDNKYDIANLSKKMNPDNSVNHIVLELV